MYIAYNRFIVFWLPTVLFLCSVLFCGQQFTYKYIQNIPKKFQDLEWIVIVRPWSTSIIYYIEGHTILLLFWYFGQPFKAIYVSFISNIFVYVWSCSYQNRDRHFSLYVLFTFRFYRVVPFFYKYLFMPCSLKCSQSFYRGYCKILDYISSKKLYLICIIVNKNIPSIKIVKQQST